MIRSRLTSPGMILQVGSSNFPRVCVFKAFWTAGWWSTLSDYRGHSMTPTQTMHCYKGNPSKWPQIDIDWFPPNMGNLLTPWIFMVVSFSKVGFHHLPWLPFRTCILPFTSFQASRNSSPPKKHGYTHPTRWAPLPDITWVITPTTRVIPPVN